MPRIERHHRHRTGVFREHLASAGDQTGIAVETALELQQQRGATRNQIAEFAHRQHPICRRSKRDALELRHFECIDAAAALGHSLQNVVMMNRGVAIRRDLQVDLDGISGSDGCLDGGLRVLDDACGRIVQSAMRNRPRDQPVETRHALPLRSP